MEQASEALARMDYLTCETQCQQALVLARRHRQWSYYARILMPLQESRRQRRMIAAEGTVRLGSTDLDDEPGQWLARLGTGCMVVTHPHGRKSANAMILQAHATRHYVEVLYVDNPVYSDSWTLRSSAGPDVTCRMPAPPGHLVNRWLEPATKIDEPVPNADRPSRKDARQKVAPDGSSATQFFLDAGEALGDAALAAVPTDMSSPQRILALERCLEVVTDHEILHQRLGDAAQAAQTE